MGNCNDKSKNSELEDNYVPNPSQADLRVFYKESQPNHKELSIKTGEGSLKFGSTSTLSEESQVTVDLQGGAKYTGFMRNGKAHGQGIYCSHQHEYEGTWQDGRPHGHGKLIYKLKNASYEGDFVNGVMHGRGLYKIGNDSNNPDFSYKGELISGRYDGFGEAHWSGGAEYSGRFLKGRYHGQGYFRWSDGKVFTGNYVDGLKEGRGKVVMKDAVFNGTWVAGKLVGDGEILMNGSKVKGTWVNGRFATNQNDF